MNDGHIRSNIRILVTIVDRGKGQKVSDLYNEHHARLHFVLLGQGTATSEIMDYLGLGTTDKDVVLSVVSEANIPVLLPAISQRMQLSKPGRGIAFTMPLSGVSSYISQLLNQEVLKEMEKEMEKAKQCVKNDLIVALVNHGFTDDVMAAAKTAGARGGTVLHARGLGFEEAEKFLGISIQAEKEIVTILTSRESKQKIMQAIVQSCGVKTEARGIVFSMPVDNLVGMGE